MIPSHVLAAVDEEVARRSTCTTEVVRPTGWRAASDNVFGWTRPDHLYRGMTADEMAYVLAHGHILSNMAHSFDFEGTSFADDAPTAEGYVNYGRDDPRMTGRPNFLLELERPASAKLDRDGYWKSKPPVPLSFVTRAWRMEDGGHDDVVARSCR